MAVIYGLMSVQLNSVQQVAMYYALGGELNDTS
jgi:hypothetical protein